MNGISNILKGAMGLTIAAGFAKSANACVLLCRYVAVTMCLLSVCSCEHRPLESIVASTNISVHVNVNTISNVTCDIYNSKIPVPEITPEVMRVLFFDMQQDRLLSDVFIQDRYIDEEGNLYLNGKVSINPGDYRMIIYSFGAEHTYISDYDSFENSTAYTDPLSEYMQQMLKKNAKKNTDKSENQGAKTDDQPIHEQPEHIMVARSFNENIPYHTGDHEILAEATSLVESYYMQVKIEGAEYVTSANAVLTSMAPSASLASGVKDYATPTSLYIPLVKSDDKGVPVICNVFNTFGRIPNSTNELKITFNVTRTDGEVFTHTFDISDLFLSEACIKHHWLLVDETIVIPDPPSTGGGFKPSVDDWEDIESEIEI